MKCCKCGREDNSGLHNAAGFKLIIESMSSISVVSTNGNNHSAPYYILCPWCQQNMFGDVKPVVDITTTTTEEYKVPIKGITYAMNKEPITVYYDGKDIAGTQESTEESTKISMQDVSSVSDIVYINQNKVK